MNIGGDCVFYTLKYIPAGFCHELSRSRRVWFADQKYWFLSLTSFASVFFHPLAYISAACLPCAEIDYTRANNVFAQLPPFVPKFEKNSSIRRFVPGHSSARSRTREQPLTASMAAPITRNACYPFHGSRACVQWCRSRCRGCLAIADAPDRQSVGCAEFCILAHLSFHCRARSKRASHSNSISPFILCHALFGACSRGLLTTRWKNRVCAACTLGGWGGCKTTMPDGAPPTFSSFFFFFHVKCFFSSNICTLIHR